MDGFNEKKWFVYMTDHHEGPFSLAEIQAKMAQSQVNTSNFVWAEGMGDWKAMTEVPGFEAILSSTGSGAATAPVMFEAHAAAPTLTTSVVATPLDVTTESPPLTALAQEEKTGGLEAADIRLAQEAAASPSISLHNAPKAATRTSAPAATISKNSPARAIKLGLLVLIPAAVAGAYFQGYLDPVLQSPAVKAGTRTVTDTVQPQLLKLAEKFPALGKWISPIPSLEDVTLEEYEGLKAAAMTKLDAGAKVAAALSTVDIFAPIFYVSSNLPDGAVIDVYVEGVPDTLLNQLSFATKVQATVDKKLGKTNAARFEDGKPLPRGEYVIYVTEGQQQPESVKTALSNIPAVTAKAPANLPRGFKLLVSKNYFLGGKKDATYDSRLKEFHDKLRAKASTELSEVKQLATMIDGQLASSVSKFTQLRSSVRKNKLSPAVRKSWGDFNKQWNSLNEQLIQGYAKWTPDALAKEYFSGILYQLTQQAGQSVGQVHVLHQAFFDGKTDPKAFEIQLATTMSTAQNALAALKTKIDQADKLAPTPNGMPRREGL